MCPWGPGQVISTIGVPARSFSSFHTWTPTPGSNPGHQPAVPALSTRGHSQLLMGARRLGRASVAAAEPRDPRPLPAGGGLPTPVQRAWGLRNPTQSPDSSSFLTYIVPAGSRATPNMHKIQSLILGTRRAQPQVSYPMQTTYSAAGQPAPQTWPPDVLCPAFVLSERLSTGSLFYNWQISRKIQISVSACKTGRRTATPSHSNTCSAPAQLPLWAGPMFQLATLSTRPYHPTPEPPRCPSPRWRLRHIWPCRPRLQESLD